MTGLNSVDDIPVAWKRVLAAVQASYPEALMAGGCLRDREHGVKVKDIDIFIGSRDNTSMEQAVNVRERLVRDGWKDIEENPEARYGGTRRGICGVLNARYPGAPQVQIVVGTWKTQQQILDEIDFGICQIGFNGQQILRTRAYREDHLAQRFRLIPVVDDDDFIRSLNRWARLKEKYPTWRLHLGSRATQHTGGTVTGRISSGPMPQQLPKLGTPYLPKTDPRRTLEQTLLAKSSELVLPEAVALRLQAKLPRTRISPVGFSHKFTIEVHPDDVAAAADDIMDTVEQITRRSTVDISTVGKQVTNMALT